MNLRGASGLVTGSSRGIGAAVATALAERGVDVVLHGRDQQRLDEAAKRLSARAFAVDLLQPGGAELLAAKTGPVDLLVHCAGVGWHGDLEAMSSTQLEQIVQVNLAAPIALTRAVLPDMLAAGRGHIAIVGSIAGMTGVAQEAVYAATKAGLAAFADSLRLEVAEHGITVSATTPGAVDTDFWLTRGVPYERRFPRMQSPEAIARAIVTAIERDTPRRIVPRWLAVAPALRSIAPGIYFRLASRLA